MVLILFCSPAILRNIYRTPQRNNIPGLYFCFLVLQNILPLDKNAHFLLFNVLFTCFLGPYGSLFYTPKLSEVRILLMHFVSFSWVVRLEFGIEIIYMMVKCFSRSELQNVFLKVWEQKWIQICPGRVH